MRFDTVVSFIKEQPGAYNVLTGDYEDGTPSEENRLANVTDASEQTMQLVYGKLKQGALVIRLQGQDPEPFDYVMIGEKRYRVDSHRRLRRLCTFTMSEVQP